ncbi:MAG: hypothetical protein F6K19_45090 [Cyanothece sp. SIO1E1]|nr:hypothetical protein [Cyanothece sp. SIO1E1]
MPIVKSKYWFVSLEHLQDPRGAVLRPAGSKAEETDQVIGSGNPLTISLESFFIKESFDRRSGNDLLVRSWTKYGNEPKIEVIHFFKKNVPDRFVGENLGVEHMFAVPDHDERNRVFIELSITEIDQRVNADPGLGNDIRSLASSFGAVFPSVLPFVSTAGRLVSGLKLIFSGNAENRTVFNSALDLYAAGTGETPLRAGAYIFFNEEIEGAIYKLRDLKLTPATNQQNVPEYDYVVVKMVARLIRSGTGEELLVNQQLQAVLSEMDENEKNDAQQQNRRLEFLQDTVRSARQLKDLDYYYRLDRRRRRGRELTPAQEERLDQLEEELRDYIF